MKKRLLAVLMSALILVCAFVPAACSSIKESEVVGTYKVKTIDGKTVKEYMKKQLSKDSTMTDELIEVAIQQASSMLGCTEDEFYDEFIIMTLKEDKTVEFSGTCIELAEKTGQEMDGLDMAQGATWRISGNKVVTTSKDKEHGNKMTFKDGELTFKNDADVEYVFVKK